MLQLAEVNAVGANTRLAPKLKVKILEQRISVHRIFDKFQQTPCHTHVQDPNISPPADF